MINIENLGHPFFVEYLQRIYWIVEKDGWYMLRQSATSNSLLWLIKVEGSHFESVIKIAQYEIMKSTDCKTKSDFDIMPS